MTRAQGTLLGTLLLVAAVSVFGIVRARSAPDAPASAPARGSPAPESGPLLEGRDAQGSAATREPQGGPPSGSRKGPDADAIDAASAVAGTITGWDGKPAAGIKVWLIGELGFPRTRWKEGEGAVRPNPTTTDAEGRYVLGGLPPTWSGHVTVRVSDTYELRGPLLTATGAEQRCDLLLPAPATLRVEVISASGERHRMRQVTVKGDPYEFAAHQDQGDGPWDLRLEEDGRIGQVQAGPGRVKVQAWLVGAPMVEGETVLQAGRTTALVLQVPSDGVVRGRVVDAQGRPVPRGNVSWSGDRHASAPLEEDGSFRLRGVGRGKGRLVASVSLEGVSGYVDAAADGVEPDGNDVVLVVRPPPRLTLRALGIDDGTPLTVALFSRSRGGTWTFDSGGREAVDVHAVPGEPTLLALFGGTGAPVVLDLGAMAAGEARDLGTLRFAAGVEVRGQVTTSDGVPLPKMQVVIAEPWSDVATKTDEAGRFTFRQVPARPLWLRLRGAGFPQHLQRVERPSSTDDLRVVVTAGGVADVRIVDADGHGVAGAPLTVYPVGEFPYEGAFDDTRRDLVVEAGGRLRARLCAGPHRLRAQKDGRKSEDAVITVREGETTEVTLVLREKPAR